MLIEVVWTHLGDDRHPLWRDQLCLYAYLHESRDWLLYVGKADYSSIRSRLRGAHKQALFRDIRQTYRCDIVRVLHGELRVPNGHRRSSALLADVESLLIKRLKPFGNIQATRSRIARPGIRVRCLGDWPWRRASFRDDG